MNRGRIGALCVVAVAALIAMAETDRLVAASLGAEAASRTLAQTIGPLAFRYTDSWQVWASAAGNGASDVGWWIMVQILLDAGFALGYGMLLWRLCRGTTVARYVVVLLLGVEAVEAVVLGSAATALLRGEAANWPGAVEAVTASLKWLLVVLLLVVISHTGLVRKRLAHTMALLAHGLYVQRLSALVVVFLGVVSLIPIADIWDQLPDVERSWTDGFFAVNGHFWFAFGSSALIAAGLFVLGRERSELTWRSEVRRLVPSGTAPISWWLIGPSAALIAATLLGWQTQFVSARTVALFVGIPVALVVISLLLRAGSLPLASRSPPARIRVRRAVYVWRTGDALALLLLTVSGLGLLRSYTAPALLWLVADSGVTAKAGAQSLFLAVAGTALAILAVWGGDRLLTGLDRSLTRPSARAGTVGARLLDPRRASPLAEPGLRWVGWALVGVGGVVLGLLLLVPLWSTARLGVVATTLLGIGSWTLIIGTITVELQRRRPLEIFRLMRLRASPVLTLLLIVPLIAAQSGGGPYLHAVRAPAGQSAAAAPRTDLPIAFQEWLERGSACDRPVTAGPGSTRARPMLLIAAQGGGIRAATWTAGVLAALQRSGGCGGSAAFLSSGVSGGSLGLALARLGREHSLQQVERLSEPDALSAAMAGLFVGDMIAGSTGVRVPALGQDGWLDRAGLVETRWLREAPVLGERFDGDVLGPTGAVVINSTVAATGCRALVSQIILAPVLSSSSAAGVGSADHEQDCSRLSSALPASLDLLSLYQPACPQQLDWTSAAMLSARFAFFMPAGRLPRPQAGPSGSACAQQPELQLIDGGYAEASGLGTLSDLAPQLAALVATHNASVQAGGAGPEGSYVVPIVLYLQNEFGSDIAADVSRLSAEVFVPLAGTAAEPLQTDAATWLQRLHAALANVCPEKAEGGCADAVHTVRGGIPGAIVVAAPYTRPAVDAPVGWSLSEFSRKRLADALGYESRQMKPGPEGYGRLGALLALLD